MGSVPKGLTEEGRHTLNVDSIIQRWGLKLNNKKQMRWAPAFASFGFLSAHAAKPDLHDRLCPSTVRQNKPFLPSTNCSCQSHEKKYGMPYQFVGNGELNTFSIDSSFDYFRDHNSITRIFMVLSSQIWLLILKQTNSGQMAVLNAAPSS